MGNEYTECSLNKTDVERSDVLIRLTKKRSRSCIFKQEQKYRMVHMVGFSLQ